MNQIRNFCIIAHIDHGKSTLADRFLEITKTVEQRKMKAQFLDRMDLERERGITIKLQPVRMEYQGYILNLIDTPGHADFTYEVSRSLQAVEAAILLVDATQGVEAQTIANLYLACEQNLTIIPVMNKIDLPAAHPEKVRKEIVNLLGCSPSEVIEVSAKTGENVEKVLAEVIKKTPPPQGDPQGRVQALIFDSEFNDYKGVVAYLRLESGTLAAGQKIRFIAAAEESEILEVGYFKPDFKKADKLMAGEIGYAVTGLKNLEHARVGDTITLENAPALSLPGYKEVKPMVFAGIFCKEGDDYQKLREAIEKLKLNDSALFYEPENSPALGFGFRCGFLGLLHLEIFQERLKREYNLDLVITAPSVAYKIKKSDGAELTIHSPQELADEGQIDLIEEPYVKIDVITPKDYLGGIMKLVQEKRGEYQNTEYLDENRVILHYHIPLAAILVDFYDNLKSLSSGYASLNYEFLDYRACDVIRMDILVAEEKVEPLSTIVYRDDAFRAGRKIVEMLKNILPKQMFMVKIQAAIGGKIIAAERLSAMRKDVTAKLYGGDVTRKRKLLEKQKKGKKKMMAMGKVDIPQEAFMAVLKR
ncbi:MAG: elongation factor 4 [Candidatus Komeilibacteria bacterium RIFCSPLOWO2_01_FULL_45_10]|uniref:Elongation factor 4 n=1 Tax=Candidatus Komeilibacteria bacterium RIFCSPLOWO2_01_FULL_45_10 TaxID=1798550 RepID=A0A1G2BJY8_9BACT|nr:MAG: elongation factor 4 [Candidatus Komeilibacteria bacterium RIFCSPLOWO2_01_FULL_45_10]